MSNTKDKKEKETKKEGRFETTTGVAKKIYQAIKKKAIDMGTPTDTSNKETEGQKWTSKKLDSGAIISFERTKLLAGKNPRYVIKIHQDNKEQSLSGEWARKTYKALTTEARRKTVKLEEEAQLFCTDALKGL